MRFPRLQIFLLLALLSITRLVAGYSSIYTFGDGVCTTTASPSPYYYYYGGRYCNSAVWIEWLCAQRGIAYSAAKNLSYYNHISSSLVTNANNLVAPADAANSLFIIWCANADFVNFVNNLPIYGDWSQQVANSINNHKTAVNTLYDKGARTIVMPNAVDIMKVPAFYFNYNQTAKSWVRNWINIFNTQFESEMAALVASKPGLKIIRPNVFNFLEQVLANPSAYGMANYYGQYALDGSADPWTVGVNFVFWDDMHPTGKFQQALANFVNPQIPELDITPPVLTLPGNLVRQASGAGGAIVTFTVTANDAVDGPVVAIATPSSGSTFPIGTTTVNVSASDAAGNPANGSFKVTVVDMKNLLKNVVITPGGANPPAIAGLIQGGPPDGQVVLQASTDMGVSDPWQDISNITLDSNGNKSFGPIQDPQGVGLTRDFFRIKLPISP